jgi:hypothetical protein
VTRPSPAPHAACGEGRNHPVEELAHQDQVNAHLKVKESAYEEARKSQAHIPGELRERIGQSRQQLA